MQRSNYDGQEASFRSKDPRQIVCMVSIADTKVSTKLIQSDGIKYYTQFTFTFIPLIIFLAIPSNYKKKKKIVFFEMRVFIMINPADCCKPV